MPISKSPIVHREVLHLRASPAQVRQFIMTPERILDYYPSPIEGGVIEPGRSIFCRGKSGVSLLEIVAAESSEHHIVVRVTTATKVESPVTKARILDSAFFTMTEDWELEETDSGTTLTKTWRDINQKKWKLLPMRIIVRSSAKGESKKLVAAWNNAAQLYEN
ncbi:MAG: hypothetical protein ACR2PS_13235 [Pseudomonadales bacterium]